MPSSVKTIVKVINLEYANERRETFSKSAENTNLEWSFFPAYTAISAPLNYNQDKAIKRFGRALSRGELACYTSHYKLWEWFLKSDYEQIIVLEDDMYVEWGVIEEIAKNDFVEKGIHKLHFHTMHWYKFKVIAENFINNKNRLLKAHGLLLACTGYLLTRQGAEALVKNTSEIFAPVDWAVSRYWAHGLPNYIIFPSPLVERVGPSTVGNQRNELPVAKSAYHRMHKLAWRILERCRRARFDA